MASPAQSVRVGDRVRGPADGVWNKQFWLSWSLFWGVHVACLAAFFTGVTVADFALFATTLFLRIFGITGGYHRYFSHRSYKTSRPFQFALALLGTSASQKGPLWWTSHHRLHHKHSDQPGDPHSPREGFWHSHVGWIFEGPCDLTRDDQVRDMARYPELVWLNRWHVVPPLALAGLCFFIGGFSGLIWGFVLSTTVCWHSTFCINSLTHRFGRVRYETGDDSRNSLILALLTLGEGWHNNHHHFQSSTRQGFFWWEIDVTYYMLRALAAVGLVWDLKEPSEQIIQARS